MAVTPASFREAFPEFSNVTIYPDTMLNRWISIGYVLLDVCRWGDLLDFGIGLFVAHSSSIQAAKATPSGKVAVGDAGVVTNKVVGPVSKAYAVSAVMMEGAGEFNSTSYGRQFIYWARLIGAGGVQL